jgi:hypothetical protein
MHRMRQRSSTLLHKGDAVTAGLCAAVAEKLSQTDEKNMGERTALARSIGGQYLVDASSAAFVIVTLCQNESRGSPVS